MSKKNFNILSLESLVPQMITCKDKLTMTYTLSNYHVLLTALCKFISVSKEPYHSTTWISCAVKVVSSATVKLSCTSLVVYDISLVNRNTIRIQLSFIRRNSVKFTESNPVRIALISSRRNLNTLCSSMWDIHLQTLLEPSRIGYHPFLEALEGCHHLRHSQSIYHWKQTIFIQGCFGFFINETFCYGQAW